MFYLNKFVNPVTEAALYDFFFSLSPGKNNYTQVLTLKRLVSSIKLYIYNKKSLENNTNYKKKNK